MLLHGWPYDIHSYADVAPAPGCGRLSRDRSVSARLRDDALSVGGHLPQRRSKRRSPLDIVALMDALEIEQGDHRRLRLGRAHGRHHRRRSGRSAARRSSAVSGYLIINLEAQPAAAAAEGRARMVVPVLLRDRARPRAATTQNRTSSTSSSGSSPRRRGTSTTRPTTAPRRRSTIPIMSTIVIHNYRWRLSLAEGEPQYDALEQTARRRARRSRVPTITIASDFDGAPADGAAYAKHIHRPVRAPRPERHRSQRAAGSASGIRQGDRRSGWLLIGQPSLRLAPEAWEVKASV